MKNIIKASVRHTALFMAFVIFLEFGAYFIASIHIPVSLIGEYAFYLAVVEFLAFFCNTQFSKFYIRHFFPDPEKQKKTFESLITTEILIALILFFCALIANQFWINRITFLLLGLSLPMRGITNMISADHEKALRFDKNNRALLGGSLTFFVISGFLILREQLFLALPAAYLAKQSVITLMLMTGRTLNLSWQTSLLRKAFPISLPLFISSFTVFYYWNIDDLYVGKVLGSIALGLYWFAFYYPHFILRIQGPFLKILLPVLSRLKGGPLKQYYVVLTKYTAYAGFGLALVALFYAPFVIHSIWGDKWDGALFAFQIYSLLIVLRMIFIYWNEIFILKNETRFQMKISFFNAVSITLLGPLFTTYFEGGINGMSLAVFVTLAMSFILMGVKVRDILVISYLKIFSLPLLLMFLSACFIHITVNFMALSPSLSFALFIAFYGTGFFLLEKDHLYEFRNYLKN